MRTIICADSLQWLPAHKDQGAIISSLPDASEQCVDRASGPSPLEQTLVFAENAE
jgi:hypothetical protein